MMGKLPWIRTTMIIAIKSNSNVDKLVGRDVNEGEKRWPIVLIETYVE